VNRRRSLRRRKTRHPAPVQHVAVIVENVSVSVDTRLRKQVDDLLDAGFRVSVITMRDPDNVSYRNKPGLRLLEYPHRRRAPERSATPVSTASP
jgi:hypothetical protein